VVRRLRPEVVAGVPRASDPAALRARRSFAGGSPTHISALRATTGRRAGHPGHYRALYR